MRFFTRHLLTLFALVSWSTCLNGQIVWNGTNGNWQDARWNTNKTALQVFGRNDGLSVGSFEISRMVTIPTGTVTYNPNVYDDFRFRGGGTLNLGTGATLQMNSASEEAGKWTQFDGDLLNVAGGRLVRTFSSPSQSGGALVFGSWNSTPNQKINVALTNGGMIDNTGQLWFGAWENNKPGIQVNMTINNGSLKLKGGEDVLLNEKGNADLVFINGYDAATLGPKKEKYAINFTGPGSIEVGSGGILNAVETLPGEYGDTGFNKLSYRDLWDRGLLQAHGFSGAKGVGGFDRYFTVSGNVGEDNYILSSTVKDPVPVVWDGGDGLWTDGKWNGGKTSQEILGRNNGLEIGSGEVGWVVNIPRGNVTYDPNANGDLRFKSGGTLNLYGGASLSLNSAADADGKWTQFDGDALNLYNATLRRTFSDPSKAGGTFILGSWRSYQDQQIKVNLAGGSRFENNGQIWFGAYGDNAPGLQVGVTINDGHLDLTGGNNYDLIGEGGESGGPGNADLVFINGWNADVGAPKREDYYINFVGPGSITTDSGILNPTASGPDGDPANYGSTLSTLQTYQDLWAKGLLRANGLSGKTGADFSQYFSVTGVSGQENYTLTSLLPAWVTGDVDGDRRVAIADFAILRNNFGKRNLDRTEGDLDGDRDVDIADFSTLRRNFGASGAQVVPEPAQWTLVMAAAALIAAVRRKMS